VLKLVTAESVTEGHPDKLADRISDGVLDAILALDPQARVAAETMVTTGLVLLAGEITCDGYVDLQADRARDRARGRLHRRRLPASTPTTAAVLIAIKEQSPDIAWASTARSRPARATPPTASAPATRGSCSATPPTRRERSCRCRSRWRTRSRGASPRCGGGPAHLPAARRQGAGDGGLRRRRRCTSTPSCSPPSTTPTSTSSAAGATCATHVLAGAARRARDEATRYYLNPTGRFVIGRPAGRRGADRPQDRRRHVRRGRAPRRRRLLGQGPDEGRPQRQLLRPLHGQARGGRRPRARCQIQMAYAIGVARPVGTYVDTFGTGTCPTTALAEGRRGRSTRVRRRSSNSSTCAARSTARPRPTATSDATASPGRRSTVSMHCGEPSASDTTAFHGTHRVGPPRRRAGLPSSAHRLVRAVRRVAGRPGRPPPGPGERPAPTRCWRPSPAARRRWRSRRSTPWPPRCPKADARGRRAPREPRMALVARGAGWLAASPKGARCGSTDPRPRLPAGA
jgi:S-adenosylmethionine synthetase